MVTRVLGGKGSYTLTHWLGMELTETITNYNYAAGEWVGNVDSGLCTSLTYAGVGVGSSAWASSGLQNVVAFSMFHTNVISYAGMPYTNLPYTGMSPEPISVYDVLQGFRKYASRLIAKEGVKLVSTDIRHWASIEEPTWKQLVIDFKVEAPSDVALALWDRLGDELEGFLKGRSTPELRDLMSVAVQWK